MTYDTLCTYLQTALKMLDGHFPDEHVRRFAVSALHEVPDEELEDILLQLTQVRASIVLEGVPWIVPIATVNMVTVTMVTVVTVT